MSKGTIIRTILAIATCLNTALMATDITGFGNPTLDVIYQATSVVINFVVVACVTWFNNDFTAEAQTGTQIAREMKATKTLAVPTVDEPEDAEVDE